jgi:hypothetical protein
MKKLFTTLALLAIFGLSANAQSLAWAKNWNSASDYNDQGYAITTDASGNVYVTGAAAIDHSGYSYIETIKYNSSGTIVWQTPSPSGGTSGTDVGGAIALDNHGNTWVTGTAYNGATYMQNIVLIKYSPTGHIRPFYPKFYPVASGSMLSRGTCLAVVDSTHVYVGGALYTNSSSTWALWVDKDYPGAAGWAWTNPYTKTGTIGSTYPHSATDLKANSSNNVWVTGFINYSSTGKDCWTAELDASTGSQTWGKAFNGAANLDDAANAMYVDANGNVWIVGYTTVSTGYKNAGIIEYNNTGTLQWDKTYTSTYESVFTDIAMGIKCSAGIMVYAGGYVGTSLGDYKYILAAFDNTAQTFSSLWSPNPITYYGSSFGIHVSGTDQGYSVAFEPTTNRVYITGRSDETTTGINITTLAYDACNGSNVWSASYDYNYDALLGGVDEMFWKYGMVVKYDVCGADAVYITGESQVSGHGFDYITLLYGYTGVPCDIVDPGDRLAHTGGEVQTGLYPNPFSTTAVLKLSPETELTNAVLSVYDISGRLVSSVNNITSNDIIINRGNLKNGLYYYTLSDNGTIITKGKFIIAD